MRRVAVTGGSGFIGLTVVRMLLERNVEPVIICRHPSPEADQLGVTTRLGDIRDRALLEQAFAGCDTVFHTAAKAGLWGEWQDFFSINVTGTEQVIAACRACGVKNLVYTSTPSVVFHPMGVSGVSESTPYSRTFLCHYAHTKALAEQLVLAANCDELRTTALRPHLVWGPGDRHLLPRLIEQGRNGTIRRVGDGHNLVDLTYIDNAAHAHLLAADNLAGPASAAGRAYFISQGEPVRLWPWINTLFQRLGIPVVRDKISFRQAYLAGMFFEYSFRLLHIKKEPPMTRFLAAQLAKPHWFTLDRARCELGYAPLLSSAEGLHRTVAWLHTKGA